MWPSSTILHSHGCGRARPEGGPRCSPTRLRGRRETHRTRGLGRQRRISPWRVELSPEAAERTRLNGRRARRARAREKIDSYRTRDTVTAPGGRAPSRAPGRTLRAAARAPTARRPPSCSTAGPRTVTRTSQSRAHAPPGSQGSGSRKELRAAGGPSGWGPTERGMLPGAQLATCKDREGDRRPDG